MSKYMARRPDYIITTTTLMYMTLMITETIATLYAKAFKQLRCLSEHNYRLLTQRMPGPY